MPRSEPHTVLAQRADQPSRQRLVFAATLGFLAVCLASSAFAQGTKPPAPVIKTETLATADGWEIPITYYQSTAAKDAAVVILLHGEGDNQLVWTQKTGLAARLHAENFAVITCDLRLHGQAKYVAKDPRNPDKVLDPPKKLDAKDYQAMASASRFSELEVIQEFLFDEHQAGRLNMGKLGILAVGDMVPIAINWAANDWTKKPYDDAPTLATKTPRGQTVRAMALLSPEEKVAGVSSAKPLGFFRGMNSTAVSFLFLNGAQDGSARDFKNMKDQVTAVDNTTVIFSESFPTKLKGADLFGRVPTADPLVVGFFKKQLQDIDVEWRDRRSRLDR